MTEREHSVAWGGLARNEAARVHALALEPPAQLSVWWDASVVSPNASLGAWLRPFCSGQEFLDHELLEEAHRGPYSAPVIQSALREAVRASRRRGTGSDALLQALYSTALASDFYRSLRLADAGPSTIARYVDMKDLVACPVDYRRVGYGLISTLTPVDQRWLVEAFSEPGEHQSAAVQWSEARLRAFARHGRVQAVARAVASGRSQSDELSGWINEQLIGSPRAPDKPSSSQRSMRLAPKIRNALAATEKSFTVVDIETTGLDPRQDRILELGAIRATASGEAVSTFQRTIAIDIPVSAEITALTGITDRMVRTDGTDLKRAIADLHAFCTGCPVFMHNAAFDLAFLAEASPAWSSGLRVHDSLEIVRAAWPSLGTARLAAVAAHLGLSEPQHRALGDAQTTLAVLIAARRRLHAAADSGGSR